VIFLISLAIQKLLERIDLAGHLAFRLHCLEFSKGFNPAMYAHINVTAKVLCLYGTSRLSSHRVRQLVCLFGLHGHT
jgi:hypothetical protein